MFRILLTITMLAAFVTPKAQAGALFADALNEPVPEQSTPTLGTIPAQFLAAGSALRLDLSTYVTGVTGTLVFTAESSNTAVATVRVSGSTLTIAAAMEGQTDVTVRLGTMMGSPGTTFRVTALAGSPWSDQGRGDPRRRRNARRLRVRRRLQPHVPG